MKVGRDLPTVPRLSVLLMGFCNNMFFLASLKNSERKVGIKLNKLEYRFWILEAFPILQFDCSHFFFTVVSIKAHANYNTLECHLLIHWPNIISMFLQQYTYGRHLLLLTFFFSYSKTLFDSFFRKRSLVRGRSTVVQHKQQKAQKKETEVEKQWDASVYHKNGCVDFKKKKQKLHNVLFSQRECLVWNDVVESLSQMSISWKDLLLNFQKS